MTFTTAALTEAAHGGLKPSPTGRLRRVLLHLSYSMALSHLLDTTPPRLLTVAACGGLEPAPDSRLRGTYPHLLHSIAPPFVSAFVAHGRLLKPRPGRPPRAEERGGVFYGFAESARCELGAGASE